MITELVSLVNQHQVVFVGIPIIIVVFVKHLCQTAVTHKTGIFVDTEVLKRCLPVLLNGWRIDHQNLGVLRAILYQKLLGYHRSDDRLAETDHISQEEAVITYQFLIAFYYGICLIVKLAITLRHIEGVFLVDGQHTVAEILHQHLDI